MSPFGQYLGPERRGEQLTPEEAAEAERMHHLRNRLGWFLLSAVTVLAVLSLVNTFVSAERAEDFQNRLVEVRGDTCEDTNQRNRDTITALDALLDQAIADHPERTRQIEQSRASTVLLINALVPIRDCEAFAAEITK